MAYVSLSFYLKFGSNFLALPILN